MKPTILAISASVLTMLSSCGSTQESSSLKHEPTAGIKTCDSEVDVPGDPHARVYATRVVFTADMKKAEISEFSTHAYNLGTGQEIFDEIYLESQEAYALKLKANQVLELVSLKTQKVSGTIEPAARDVEQIKLTQDNYTETLKCRIVKN